MATAAVSKYKHLHPREELHVQNISISSIKVGKRMRPLGDITSLVASIPEVGLMNPIMVTRDRRLISDLHRLEAFKVLGRKYMMDASYGRKPA
jgi:hypothetical protein